MRLTDDIPAKLLDCEEIEDVIWPAEFIPVGQAVRIDYTTSMHTGFESFELFKHTFSSGVEAYVPVLISDDGPAEGEEFVELEEPYSPIMMGVVDRLIVARDNCVTAFSSPELRDEPLDVAVDAIGDLETTFLAWDPEDKKLILVAVDGTVVAVLNSGFLELDPEGMIAG